MSPESQEKLVLQLIGEPQGGVLLAFLVGATYPFFKETLPADTYAKLVERADFVLGHLAETGELPNLEPNRPPVGIEITLPISFSREHNLTRICVGSHVETVDTSADEWHGAIGYMCEAALNDVDDWWGREQ